MLQKLKLPFVVIISVLVATPLLAQEKKLKVGIAGSPPFVIRQENNSPEGISLDIWEEIATDNQLSYEIIPQKNVMEGITQVEQGKIDVLIGPVSIRSGDR